MKIFARALATNPEAPEILLAVSHGYAQEGRQDPEARAIYERALVHHAQDKRSWPSSPRSPRPTRTTP